MDLIVFMLILSMHRRNRFRLNSTKVIACEKGSITDTFHVNLLLSKTVQNTFKSMNCEKLTVGVFRKLNRYLKIANSYKLSRKDLALKVILHGIMLINQTHFASNRSLIKIIFSNFYK